MGIGVDSLLLEEALGYKFNNISYLDCALTHSSYTNEMRTKGIKAESNERLEFLGDAVLEMVISEYLYNNFSKHREGSLTKMRQLLVCEKALARVAERIELGKYINIGNGEEQNGCRTRPKVLADALEAVIGAVYLDCIEQKNSKYCSLILSLFENEIKNSSLLQSKDYKTMLQQFAEQEGTAMLEYRVVKESGPEHDKKFTVSALINNNEVGMGVAGTKKDAEMQAAKAALMLFGIIL